MNLKKINPHLQQALIEHGLTEANEMQQATFSTIKSGADAVFNRRMVQEKRLLLF